MAQLNKLNGTGIKTASAGKYGDGGGLWLHKRDKSRGKWLFLFKIHGRRREMGLGTYPAVSLEKAREKATKWRAVRQQGLDPIKEQAREKRESERNMHILNDIALDAFESRKAELKQDGVAGRWFSPLTLHVLPKLGKVPVSEIDQIDIRDTLAPIWHNKASTADKAISRLSICLQHAAALGLDVDLQAVQKARALLGKQRHTVKHIPHVPWREVPAFYASLDDGSTTHLALRLVILTLARSKTVRQLHVDQLNGDVWTIPGEDMKGRKGATSEFRVPLSTAARDVIDQALPFARDGFLFPNVRKGVISDATMSRLMERRGMEARPHGFRTSFRTWVQDTDATGWEVSETILAHIIAGKVERSYAQSDMLDRRAPVMQAWADYVAGTASGEASTSRT